MQEFNKNCIQNAIKCDSGTIMAVKRIRATADRNEGKYFMRDVNVIAKDAGTLLHFIEYF